MTADRCPHCGQPLNPQIETVETPQAPLDRNMAKRNARLFVLGRANAFARKHPDFNRRQADEGYAGLFNAGGGGCPDWVRQRVKKVSRSTLERWRSQSEIQGSDWCISSAERGMRRFRSLPDDVKRRLEEALDEMAYLSARQLRDKCCGSGPQSVSLRTINRFMAEFRRERGLERHPLASVNRWNRQRKPRGADAKAD